MCPYQTWQRGYFLFCEAQRCSWIREPLNTYSNVGFFAVGIWLFIQHRHLIQLRLIGLSAILIGVLSAFYHATSSEMGEILDLGSVYLLLATLVCFNSERMGLITPGQSEAGAAVIAISGMLSLVFFKSAGQPIFVVLILSALILEVVIYRRAKSNQQSIPYRYGYLWAAIGFHLAAFTFWQLDHQRILCFPESRVFQGHALWHLLGAVTFPCLDRFYGQFVKQSHRRRQTL